MSAHAEVGDGSLSILGTSQNGDNLDEDYESEGYGRPTVGCPWTCR